jgi:hypothetical protein
MPDHPTPPPLEFAFEARVEIADPIVVGPTPRGERRMIPILRGEFDGPALRGRILPGGADWQVLRPDGVTELCALYLLETDSGARVQVMNRGLRHGPAEVMNRLRAGEDVDPSQYYFRAAPEFETAAPELDWMNRSLFVATGERHPNRVVVRFWRLT